jgi:hypothetical protein
MVNACWHIFKELSRSVGKKQRLYSSSSFTLLLSSLGDKARRRAILSAADGFAWACPAIVAKSNIINIRMLFIMMRSCICLKNPEFDRRIPVD